MTLHWQGFKGYLKRQVLSRPPQKDLPTYKASKIGLEPERSELRYILGLRKKSLRFSPTPINPGPCPEPYGFSII
jgi:hypothetical protein